MFVVDVGFLYLIIFNIFTNFECGGKNRVIIILVFSVSLMIAPSTRKYFLRIEGEETIKWVEEVNQSLFYSNRVNFIKILFFMQMLQLKQINAFENFMDHDFKFTPNLILSPC